MALSVGMELEAEAVFRSLRGLEPAAITLPQLATRLSDFGVAEEHIQHILLHTVVEPDGSVQLDSFIQAVKAFRRESQGFPSPRPDHGPGACMLFGLPKDSSILLSPPGNGAGMTPALHPPVRLAVLDDGSDDTTEGTAMQQVVQLRMQLAATHAALWKHQQRAAAAIEHVHTQAIVPATAVKSTKAHPMRLHVLRHHIASLYKAKIKENAADDQHGRKRVKLTEYLSEYLVHVYGLHAIARTHEQELIAGVKKNQASDRRTFIFGRLACSPSGSMAQEAGNQAAESVLELLELLFGDKVEIRMTADYVGNTSWQGNMGRGVGCQQALTAMKHAQPGAAAHRQRRKQAAAASATAAAAASTAAVNQTETPPSEKELQLQAELAEMRKLVALARGCQAPKPEPEPEVEPDPQEKLPIDEHAPTIMLQLQKAAQIDHEDDPGRNSVSPDHQLVDVDFVVDRFLAFAFPEVYNCNGEDSKPQLQDQYTKTTMVHLGRPRRHTTPMPDPDDSAWIKPMRLTTLRHHIACIYCKKIRLEQNEIRRLHERETLLEFVNEHYVPTTYGCDEVSVKVMSEMSLGINESQRTDRRVSLFGKISCLHEPERWTPDHILAADLVLSVLEAAVSFSTVSQGAPAVETAMQSETASVTLAVAKRAIDSVRKQVTTDQQRHESDETHHAHFVTFPPQQEVDEELKLLADACGTSQSLASKRGTVSRDFREPMVLIDLLLDWLTMRIFPAVYGTRHDHHGFRAAHGADHCEDEFSALLSKLERGGMSREKIVSAERVKQPAWLPAGTSRKKRAILAVLKEMTAHGSDMRIQYLAPLQIHQIHAEILEIILAKTAADQVDDSHNQPRIPLLEFIADEHFRHKYGVAELAIKHLANLSWGCREHRVSDRRIHTFVALSSIVNPEEFSHDHVVASDATFALLVSLLNHGQQYGRPHHEHSERLTKFKAGEALYLPVHEVVDQATDALPSGYKMKAPEVSRIMHTVAAAQAGVIDIFVVLDLFVSAVFHPLLPADELSGGDPTLKVQDEITQVLEDAGVESEVSAVQGNTAPPCGPSIKPMQLRPLRKHIAGVWYVLITRERDRLTLCRSEEDRGSGLQAPVNLAEEFEAYTRRMYGLSAVARRTLHEFSLGIIEYVSSDRRTAVFCMLCGMHQLQSQSATVTRATAAAACVELLLRVVPHRPLRCLDKLQSYQPGESGNGVPVEQARDALREVVAAAEAAGQPWAQGQSSAGSVIESAIAQLDKHADATMPPCVSIDKLLWLFVPHAFPELLDSHVEAGGNGS